MILNNKLLRILQNQSIKTPIGNLYKTFNTLPLQLLHEYKFWILSIHLLIIKENYLLYLSLTLFRINAFILMIQEDNVIYILVAYN